MESTEEKKTKKGRVATHQKITLSGINFIMRLIREVDMMRGVSRRTRGGDLGRGGFESTWR